MSLNLIQSLSVHRNHIAMYDVVSGEMARVTPTSTDGKELSVPVYCQHLCNNGVDELFITEVSSSDVTHDRNIDTVKEIVTLSDHEVYFAGNIKRIEDIKKFLYTGAKHAVLDLDDKSNVALLKEAADRFGAAKLAAIVTSNTSDEALNAALNNGIKTFFTADVSTANKLCEEDSVKVVLTNVDSDVNAINDACTKCNKKLFGVAFKEDAHDDTDYMDLKDSLSDMGYEVNVLKSKINFSELKTNSDGLIPCIVQDYQTGDVLMLAYMNELSFEQTLKTGRMTYYSRSRQEIWEKGYTSGHYQYVKELSCDCDNDTLLAKVYQVGAACHTGKRSCFFNELFKLDYSERDPHKVLEEVYNVILDRKKNPKEGSYTNYLFDKGIDKVLKKCGEEASEIIIAAKNPNPEETKYEISDFLYHVMVLMAIKGITWDDVMTELARR